LVVRVFGIALLIFGIAACSSGGTTAPTSGTPGIGSGGPALPTPTPSLLRTATPEPTIAPTIDWTLDRDWLAEQLLVEADSVASNARRFEGGDSRDLDVLVPLYVPLYLASRCVEGKKPSVEDFRVFANNSISKRTLVDQAAVRVIRVIISAADSWRTQSLDAATQHCLQPYLYPESASDANPAIDLYLVSSLPSLSPLAKSGFEVQVRERARRWFDQIDPQEPYISWLCGDNC